MRRRSLLVATSVRRAWPLRGAHPCTPASRAAERKASLHKLAPANISFNGNASAPGKPLCSPPLHAAACFVAPVAPPTSASTTATRMHLPPASLCSPSLACRRLLCCCVRCMRVRCANLGVPSTLLLKCCAPVFAAAACCRLLCYARRTANLRFDGCHGNASVPGEPLCSPSLACRCLLCRCVRCLRVRCALPLT